MRPCWAGPGLLAAAVLAAALIVVGPAADPAWVAPAPASAQGGGGFVSETVVSMACCPTDFAFAPDGRIFIAFQNGTVRILKDGALLPDPFISLTTVTYIERGLMGLALAPDFATTGHVYLYYTYESDASNPQGPKTNRLIRVTADGDVALAGSEVVVLGTVVGDPDSPSCEDFPVGTDCIPADGESHIGGAIAFAPDGTLFVTTGDAASPFGGLQPLALRSQDLDSLAGKLLHINSDGTAVSDNPFFTGDPADNRSKVYAYGFRNPFRMGLHPGTGVPFIGNVGWGLWEEIEAAEPGVNYGWPCYEGTQEERSYQVFTFCQDMYASGQPVGHPVYQYPHGGGAAVIGGVFYGGANYPSEFQGALFFGDWVRRTISILNVDANNDLVPGSVKQVATSAGSGAVDFEIGPKGDVYYLTLGVANEVRRLTFVEGNQAPVAQASAVPQGGLAPLTVQFSSAGSFDPEGDALSFFWSFGDSQTSDEPNPSHAYTEDGTYQVTLTVADPDLAEDMTQVAVIVGNQPPTALILEPPADLIYVGGQTVAFVGRGTDPEDGLLPGASKQWTVTLHHCFPATTACHTHPFQQRTGTSGTLIAPTQGDEIVFLEMTLIVTDSVGLTGSSTILIGPDTDGDGVRDFEELLTHGTDYLDPDTDGDGMPDGYEIAHACLDPLVDDAAADPDGDGLTNIEEFAEGTDPCLADSDNDGLPDQYEDLHDCLDPLVPDAGADPDGDGLNNLQEFQLGTDPCVADTDGDGCLDGREAGPYVQSAGGLRDPLNFWDFFDTPDPNAVPQRSRAVDIDDLFRVAMRFGMSGDKNVDPLSTPPKSGYHPAYDRSAPAPGAYPWALGPADGAITIDEIFWIAAQFAHSCG